MANKITCEKLMPDFVKKASEELGHYGKEPIVTAELSAVSTIELIGLLQLATRHPQLPARQLEFARDIVAHFSKAFKPEHTGIAELIKKGWEQQYDKAFDA
jgi:hypothetical protein